MEKEGNFGLMVQNIKEFGKMILLMGLEELFLQMEIYIKENGKMIKLMGLENILKWMVLFIMEIFLIINFMVRVNNNGQMVQNLKETMLMDLKMDLVN